MRLLILWAVAVIVFGIAGAFAAVLVTGIAAALSDLVRELLAKTRTGEPD